MLECIDGGDPWEDVHDAFQMSTSSPVRIRSSIEFLKKLVPQQLHAHGGNFAEFDGRTTIRVKVLIARRQRVERVTGFVKNRLHVALNSDGVHEDEGQTCLGKR